MTDRELLKAAAKAAGYKLYIWGKEGDENVARMDTLFPTKWNPITDDGDALRLAVDLAIRCEPIHSYGVAFAGSVCAKQFGVRVHGDKYSAQRRAIVMAAASIGGAQ